eukprot:4601367-Prymnesium_polylepis.3
MSRVPLKVQVWIYLNVKRGQDHGTDSQQAHKRYFSNDTYHSAPRANSNRPDSSGGFRFVEGAAPDDDESDDGDQPRAPRASATQCGLLSALPQSDGRRRSIQRGHSGTPGTSD